LYVSDGDILPQGGYLFKPVVDRSCRRSTLRPKPPSQKAAAGVREELCEGAGDATLHLHLEELYRAIQRLMDETSAAQDQDLKVLLADLEHDARLPAIAGTIAI
jgi:hypothetical protein